MATEYVIFAKDEDADHGVTQWRHLGVVSARSASSAIRHYINGGPGEALLHVDNAGEYAAVPLRSWQPVKVAVETKTQLKFS